MKLLTMSEVYGVAIVETSLRRICNVKFWENRQLAPVAYLKYEQNVNEFPQHELLQFSLTITATSVHNLSSFTFENPPK
jgi:hypothetical protein